MNATLKRHCLAGCLIVACLTGLVPHAMAQAGPQQRWLLVFDTSADMKKRLPALETELQGLFVTDMGQHLRSGDSVGVWFFNDALHSGSYPLLTWQSENAMETATNMMKAIRKQEFKGQTEFDLLQPLLGAVIQHSERLTVMIFCDGEGQIVGTPYDEGINENLQTGMAERKKHRQPVVITLRTQQGKFVGATVNYPPTDMTIPTFPPLQMASSPGSAPVQTAPPPPPPPAPAPSLPPLIIVGNTAGTDVTAAVKFDATNVPPKISPVAMVTNPPVAPVAMVAPPTNTNEVASLPPANPPSNPATNVVLTLTTTNPVSTNMAAGTADNGTGADRSTMILLTLGGGLLGAAVVLVIWLLLLRRRPPTSLITRLMSEDPRYRK